MMKAQNKNRKHPTCSRCRFHGKKDIRVLQHQCPFRNCTCSSCFLIKAQKNLDKHDENSDDTSSPVGSVDSTLSSPNYKEIASVAAPKSVSSNQTSEFSSDNSSFGSSASASSGVTSSQSWETLKQMPHSVSAPSVSVSKNSENHLKVGDFQSLCVTFPDHKPSQLQALFEQCGKDFQRTIDRILMTKWCSEESKSPHQYQNNNEWSSPNHINDYAPSYGSGAFTSSPYHDPTPSNNMFHHSNNIDQCIDWRSNSYTTYNEEYYTQDYSDVNDYSYEQGIHNQSSSSQNLNFDYSSYWYGNSQGNSSGAASYDTSGRGYQNIEESYWQNGHGNGHVHGQGDNALGQPIQGYK